MPLCETLPLDICLLTAEPAFDPEVVVTDVRGTDGAPIVAQKYELTIAEWNRCHAAGACALQLTERHKRQEADYPATGINWLDIQQYLAWINRQSRKAYRLPSREEWDALAQEVLPEASAPLFDDPRLDWASA